MSEKTVQDLTFEVILYHSENDILLERLYCIVEITLQEVGKVWDNSRFHNRENKMRCHSHNKP